MCYKAASWLKYVNLFLKVNDFLSLSERMRNSDWRKLHGQKAYKSKVTLVSREILDLSVR